MRVVLVIIMWNALSKIKSVGKEEGLKLELPSCQKSSGSGKIFPFSLRPQGVLDLGMPPSSVFSSFQVAESLLICDNQVVVK